MTMTLSPEEIATSLCLSVQIISDIENDRLDSKISPLFSKGYIKSYAKIVGVDQDVALNLFEQQYQACGATDKMQSFSQRTKSQNHNNYLNAVTILIVLGFIAMLVIWWWQQSSDLARDEQSNAEPTVAMVTVDTTRLNAIVPVLTPILQLPADSSVLKSQPVSSHHQLEFVFMSECWLKVTDASNEVLTNGKKMAGLTLMITGVSPFEINLSQPCDANIFYQEQLLDISPFITGKTARFNVPMES